MCECTTQVNDILKPHNTRLAFSFLLTKDLSGMDCTPMLSVEKIDASKRGRPMHVIPTFCPFCGTKYPRKGEEGEGLPDNLRGDAS